MTAIPVLELPNRLYEGMRYSIQWTDGQSDYSAHLYQPDNMIVTAAEARKHFATWAAALDGRNTLTPEDVRVFSVTDELGYRII